MIDFIKSTSKISRVLFILGVLTFFIGVSVELSIENCFFPVIIFIYPALAIDISKNDFFSKSNLKFIHFLNKTKVSSRILFGCWLFFGIAGSGFVISDIIFGLSLMAIFFLIPAIIIEWRCNPLFIDTRERVANRKKELANIHKQKKEQRLIEAKNRKIKKLEIRKKGNASYSQNNNTESKNSYSPIKEIERQNKEAVYQLIQNDYKNHGKTETKNAGEQDSNRIKEIEHQNKKSVYALIKENSFDKEKQVAEQPDSEIVYSDLSIDTERLDQDFKERVNRGEEVYINMTWGSVSKKQATVNSSIKKVQSGQVISAKSSKKAESKSTIPIKSEKELLQELLDEIDIMEGHEFEYFCANLLRDNGYVNVEVTPGSGDQGADIIAEKGEIRYAIQCKRFNNNLNNKAVQEILGGRGYYRCNIGIVLTNSYFNTNAIALASATGVWLWDRDELIKLIRSSGQLSVRKDRYTNLSKN